MTSHVLCARRTADILRPGVEILTCARCVPRHLPHSARSFSFRVDGLRLLQFAEDSLISAQSTWRSISIDPHIPVNAMYGPGLVFSVKMRVPERTPTHRLGAKSRHLFWTQGILWTRRSPQWFALVVEWTILYIARLQHCGLECSCSHLNPRRDSLLSCTRPRVALMLL